MSRRDQRTWRNPPETNGQGGLMSYAAIGKALGLSPVRVRFLEQRALAKVREGMRRLGIRGTEQ